MPDIVTAPSPTLVRLPLLRTLNQEGKILFQIVGSVLAPVGYSDGLFLGPNGYTNDIAEAQNFATQMTEDTVIIENPGAPGKSAYELWLMDGNEGTMADYLTAMHGSPGSPGSNATDAQVASAVAAFMEAHPVSKGNDGADATPEQISAAVAAYFVAHPVKDGDPGKPGKDAPAVTADQLAAVVTAYFQANPIVVPAPVGPTGGQVADAVAAYIRQNPPKDGANATDSQVAVAVATYLKANPPTKGDTGPSAKVSLGTISIVQAPVLISLQAGLKKMQVTGIAGLKKGEDVLLFPVNPTPAGYAIHDVVAIADGTIEVTLTTPLLAIGAGFTIPCRLVALR